MRTCLMLGSFDDTSTSTAHDFSAQYSLLGGEKYFFPSARAAAQGLDASTKRRIAHTLLTKTEIVPLGEQGRAILGPNPQESRRPNEERSYIIDGPAGTGKSTVAVQKLILEKGRKFVVVKNDQVIADFEGLL